MNAAWATTENNPFDGGVLRKLYSLRERMDLAVDVQFADAASDQLGVLRPVIENEDGAGQRDDAWQKA